MHFDNDRLQELFAVYQSTRSDADLAPLWAYMTLAARVQLGAYLRKIKVQLSQSRREEVVTDAVGRFVVFLLENPDRRETMPIRHRLLHELIYQLHGQRTKRHECAANIDDAPDADLIPGETIKAIPSPAGYIRQLLGDSRLNGRRVVFDLFSHKYYRTAILKIAKYTDRDIMREYAVQLHTIFTMTRITWTRVPRARGAAIRFGSRTTFSSGSLMRALRTDSRSIRQSLSLC